MDVVLQSNKESVVLTSLGKALRTDLSYKISKNFPNVSKHLVELQPNIAISGAAEGKEVMFNLPRYGLLSNLMIQSTLTTAGNNDAVYTNDQPLGLCLFETMELRSQNRVVVTNSDAYLRVRADNAEFGAGQAVFRRARIFSTDETTPATTWSNAAIVTYTPFYCGFFERVENHIDLEFTEQMQLRCVFNTLARIGTDAATTAATVTCWMWYYNLQAEHLNELRARNFSPDKPLSMLTYDTFVETGTLTDDATSTTVTLNVNRPVFASHLFLRQNASGGDAAFINPKTVSVKLGGKTIYDAVPSPIMQLEGDMKHGNAGTYFSNAGVVNDRSLRPITIHWGLDKARWFNSGAVSFHNINIPQITFSHVDPGTTTDYYIVHEFWTISTIETSNGKIEVSASS